MEATPENPRLVTESEGQLLARHKSNFEQLCFPEGVDRDIEGNSKMLSQAQWEYRLMVLRNWENGTHNQPKLEFRKAHPQGYRFVQRFSIREVNGQTQLLFAATEKIVVPKSQVFDYILEAHRQAGHMAPVTTHNLVKIKCYNISLALCKIFKATCPVCNTQKQSRKQHKGAKKPIRSSHFRDRYQCDLIDKRADPKVDGHGVECKWLMVLKDHFSRLVYLRPIPTKSPEHVAYELSIVFGLLGYPVVYHSDRGNEVHGNPVLSIVRSMHPDCRTVAGRSRTPRDQGSVERANQMIKKVLEDLEEEERMAGRIPNWTMLIGRVLSIVNAALCPGRDNESPYKVVFGMDFHEPAPVSMEVLREAETVEDLSKLMCSPGFDARMRHCGELPTPGCKDDESVESSATEYTVSTAAVRALFEDGEKPVKQEQCEDDTKPAAVRSLKDLPWDVIITKSRQKVSLFQAFASCHHYRTLIHGGKHKFVYPWFNGVQLSVGDSEYYQACAITGRWWESELIATYLTLKSHDVGNPEIMHVQSLAPEMDPKELRKHRRDIPEGVKELLCIAFKDNHFALIEFDLETKCATVKDGFGYSLTHWIPHCDHIVQKYCLAPEHVQVCTEDDSDYDNTSEQWYARLDGSFTQTDGYNCGPIACMLAWRKLDPEHCRVFTKADIRSFRMWIVDDLLDLLARYAKELSVNRKATVIEILESVEETKTLEENPTPFCALCSKKIDVDGYYGYQTLRPCCHTFHFDCLGMWRQTNQNRISCPLCKTATLRIDDSSESMGMVSPITKKAAESLSKLATVSQSAVALNATAVVVQSRIKQRDESEKKRKRFRQGQEKKMKRAFMEQHAVKPGDVVAIAVAPNERTNACPRSVLGVVYEVSKGGSAKVCTEWGRITEGRQGQPAFLGCDRLSVRSEHATISPALLVIRDLVVDGSFDPDQQGKLTITAAQRRMLGHEVMQRGCCGCKKGCNNRCGCVGKGIPCSSSCACGGSCGNPHN